MTSGTGIKIGAVGGAVVGAGAFMLTGAIGLLALGGGVVTAPLVITAIVLNLAPLEWLRELVP